MKGLQKLQEEILKQEEIISTCLSCPMNNWFYIEILETAGLWVFCLTFFIWFQDLRTSKYNKRADPKSRMDFS